MPTSDYTSKFRVGVAACTTFVCLTIGLAACGGDNNDVNRNEGPSTTTRVKNMPLNNCVSVISGDRPAPGVTIPRCVPTTLPGNPNKPKKG